MDVITFQETTVEEIEGAFKDSINDYIDWCKSEGVAPEKPYSSRFNLRLSPELHREVAITASTDDTGDTCETENCQGSYYLLHENCDNLIAYQAINYNTCNFLDIKNIIECY